MKRLFTATALVLFLSFALPYNSPAPLIYTPGVGWTYERVGKEGKWTRTRAKEQLAVAQKALEEKDYSLARKAAAHTVKRWPLSDYAPEAQFIDGQSLEAQGRYEQAFKSYQKLVDDYPKFDKYDEVLERQYNIANEFLDALPAHQFQRTANGWRERMVGISEDGESLCLALAPGPTPALALLPIEVMAGNLGAVAEIQPTAIALTRTIAARIGETGGAALLIDYGYDGGQGDTLQAVRKHGFHDVLQSPGEADLTVHVDFAALRQAIGAAARILGPVGQGDFLGSLGVAVRAQMLMKSATKAQAKEIEAAHSRLVDPAEMGALFKVLGVAPHGAPRLPGFE